MLFPTHVISTTDSGTNSTETLPGTSKIVSAPRIFAIFICVTAVSQAFFLSSASSEVNEYFQYKLLAKLGNDNSNFSASSRILFKSSGSVSGEITDSSRVSYIPSKPAAFDSFIASRGLLFTKDQ